MRKPSLLILFLTAIQLTACSSSNATLVPTKHLPATPAITMTIPSNLKAISTASPTAEINQCWKKLPDIPSGVTLPGKLVLSVYSYSQVSFGMSILDFTQNRQREISHVFENESVSPDGKWLAYFQLGQIDNTLIVESSDGQVKARIPVGEDWLILMGSPPWLDNERLWISTWPDIKKGESAPVVIINPFTGKQQKILSNYPGLERYLVGQLQSAGLHFGYSSAIYDPSLEMVVYPEFAEDGWDITLWDRQSHKALVKIPEIGTYDHSPLWLPDANQFVVPAQPDRNSPREWLMVSRDGTVRQLTHFHDLYGDKFEIGPHYSISPDGNYLAFGLSQNEDTDSSEPKQLMILNLKTLEITIPCISYFYPRPVWSPDSQYLVVKATMDRKPSGIAVLNLKDQWITDLKEDAASDPVGWLKFP